jgi:hypothetical protein
MKYVLKINSNIKTFECFDSNKEHNKIFKLKIVLFMALIQINVKFSMN